ncbi:MAG TPA: hypothetical protein VLW44_12655, partial [Streptosporangiaceae bacterium]|nr:hypothetical protein [Streptosporangiaceae bacterium]
MQIIVAIATVAAFVVVMVLGAKFSPARALQRIGKSEKQPRRKRGSRPAGPGPAGSRPAGSKPASSRRRRDERRVLLPADATVTFAAERRSADIDAILTGLEEDLVGLVPVKKKVSEIAALLLVDRARNKFGLAAPRPNLHMCF